MTLAKDQAWLRPSHNQVAVSQLNAHLAPAEAMVAAADIIRMLASKVVEVITQTVSKEGMVTTVETGTMAEMATTVVMVITAAMATMVDATAIMRDNRLIRRFPLRCQMNSIQGHPRNGHTALALIEGRHNPLLRHRAEPRCLPSPASVPEFLFLAAVVQA